MEVVENKNAPGNGLAEPQEIDPEMEPLKMTSKGYRYPHNERSDLANMDDLNEADCLDRMAYKCRITPKKGLMYLIVTSSIIFLLLLILILLAVSWPRSPSAPVCQTAQCHEFASKVLGAVNQSVEPCEDIWEFSCGGWLKANPIPKSKAYWSSEDLEHFQIKTKIRNLLNTLPTGAYENSVDVKINRFYQSCTNIQYIESDGDKPLKKIITSLGGWNVLRSFRAADFDFPRLFKKLHSEYRTSPFFQVKVVPDPKTPARNIIKILPAGLSLVDKYYYFKHEDPVAAAFRLFAKDVVQEFGATSTMASQFADEIFNFEKRVAEITPEKLDLRDPIESYEKVTVEKLKSMSNTIFWSDFLKAIFPQGTINDKTEVLVPKGDYLQDISSIISTTDRGNLNNYLIWHLTLKYLPYLSKQYTESLEQFRKDTIGSFKELPRWEFCIDETVRFFPHAINALLAESSDNWMERREKVEKMFDSMRSAFSERLDSLSRFDESMKNFAIDKLRLMSIQIGTPLRNRTVLEDFYFPLDVQNNDFFVNVIIATTFGIKVEQTNLANPSKESGTLSSLSESLFRPHFVPTSNKIFFPEAALHNDILSLDNSHLPLIYGSVGVQIGEAMGRAFGIEDGLYLSDGAQMSILDHKTQTSRGMIETKRSCIDSFFSKIRLDDEDYTKRTSLDTTMHLAGIQIAFDTLKTLEDEGNFQILPGLESFSTKALFFISYGQSQCSSSTMLYHDMEHAVFTSLSHDHRTKGLLRQMVGFSRAFQCSKNSYMYADFTCGIVL